MAQSDAQSSSASCPPLLLLRARAFLPLSSHLNPLLTTIFPTSREPRVRTPSFLRQEIYAADGELCSSVLDLFLEVVSDIVGVQLTVSRT